MSNERITRNPGEMDNYDYRFKALAALFREIADHCGKEVSENELGLKEVTFVLEEADRRLKTRMHTSSKDHTQKVINGREVYSFSGKSDIHHRLAYTLYALRNQQNISGNKIQTDFDEKRYLQHWDAYLVDYKRKVFNLKKVQLVNNEFWIGQKGIANRKEVLRQFLEKNNSLIIPKIISSELLPIFEPDRPLYHQNDGERDTLSLKTIISHNESHRQLIELTSNDSLEGKSYFCWSWLYKYKNEFNCIWINDLSFDTTDLPNQFSFEAPIIIFMDGLLEGLKNHPDALIRAYNQVDEKYFDKPITLIISDSSRLLSQNSPQDSIGFNFNSCINISKFRITDDENEKILSSLLKEFADKQIPNKRILDFRIRQNQLPLGYRVENLLDLPKSKGREWDIWKKDELVRKNGLTDLYFLVAFLGYHNIKVPYDYKSNLLLPGVNPITILEFLNSHNEMANIISINSEYASEYPNYYLEPANYAIATCYVKDNSEVKIKANAFVRELFETIESGKAENSHSYIFRKLYANKVASSKNSPIHKQLYYVNSIGLLDKQLNALNIDFENKEKIKGEKALALLRRNQNSLAKDLLDSLINQEDSFVIYMRAKIFFEDGKYERCLEELSKLEVATNVATLRRECFLSSMEFTYRGIDYYISKIQSPVVQRKEFRSMMACIERLVRNEKFKDAEQFLKDIEKQYNSIPNIVQQSLIKYSLADLYFKWATSSELLVNELIEKASLVLEEAKNINAHGSSYFSVLDAKILAYRGHFEQSIDILEPLITRTFNIKINYALANIYLTRAKAYHILPEEDYKKMCSLMESNIEYFEKKTKAHWEQTQTYELYARIHEKAGKPDLAITLLQSFIYKAGIRKDSPESKNLFHILDRLKRNN